MRDRAGLLGKLSRNGVLEAEAAKMEAQLAGLREAMAKERTKQESLRNTGLESIWANGKSNKPLRASAAPSNKLKSPATSSSGHVQFSGTSSLPKAANFSGALPTKFAKAPQKTAQPASDTPSLPSKKPLQPPTAAPKQARKVDGLARSSQPPARTGPKSSTVSGGNHGTSTASGSKLGRSQAASGLQSSVGPSASSTSKKTSLGGYGVHARIADAAADGSRRAAAAHPMSNAERALIAELRAEAGRSESLFHALAGGPTQGTSSDTIVQPRNTLLYGEVDEEAERASFKAAVQEWRQGVPFASTSGPAVKSAGTGSTESARAGATSIKQFETSQKQATYFSQLLREAESRRAGVEALDQSGCTSSHAAGVAEDRMNAPGIMQQNEADALRAAAVDAECGGDPAHIATYEAVEVDEQDDFEPDCCDVKFETVDSMVGLTRGARLPDAIILPE